MVLFNQNFLKKTLVLDCMMTNVVTVVTGKGEQLTSAGE